MNRFMSSGVWVILVLILVNNALNGGLSDPISYITDLLIMLPGIIIGLSFHEFAHGFVSYKLGDPTPKNQGRLTLNPKAHFDLFGFLALVFLRFGWGKPVQINPNYYKNKRRDELLVAIAGVTMNLIIAVVVAVIVRFIFLSNPNIMSETYGDILVRILMGIISINLVLLLFNLIPVPPLDGFNVITQLFNLRETKLYYTIYNNGFIILLVLLLFGVIDTILTPAFSFLYNLIVAGIIFA